MKTIYQPSKILETIVAEFPIPSTLWYDEKGIREKSKSSPTSLFPE